MPRQEEAARAQQQPAEHGARQRADTPEDGRGERLHAGHEAVRERDHAVIHDVEHNRDRGEAGPEQMAIDSESSARMAALLQVLPEKQREIIILRVVVGMSAEETAEAVGSTAGAVRVAQHRALSRLKARKIPVMLAGMKAARNLGPDYAARFDAIYPDLAGREGLVLYPFFLDGVAADAKLNQGDGMHPTAEGVDVIVRNIMPKVEAFIGTISRQAS